MSRLSMSNEFSSGMCVQDQPILVDLCVLILSLPNFLGHEYIQFSQLQSMATSSYMTVQGITQHSHSLSPQLHGMHGFVGASMGFEMIDVLEDAIENQGMVEMVRAKSLIYTDRVMLDA